MAKAVVMIVDDEEGIRATLSGIFEDEGYVTVSAGSGEEAIRLAKESPPDIVVLDVWLSGMDGIQTMKELRDSSPDLPVIIISGHANIELAVKATKIGAYDILEKPLSMEKVLLTVHRALEKRNLEIENNKALFVTSEANTNLYLSGRNLQNTRLVRAQDLNTYDILRSQKLVLSEHSVDLITKSLS